MSRCVRGLLACLLFLAIPTKGAWAADTTICVAVHAPIAAVHDSDARGHQRGHASPEDGGVHSSPAPDTGGGPLEAAGHGGCVDCSACCLGATLIDTTTVAAPYSPGARPEFPAVLVQFAGHAPAAPEPPPRNVPA